MAKKVKSNKKSQDVFSSFTYFIPAPPSRKTGYREKEFDKILSGILQSGFEIIQIQTQTLNTETSSGLFVIILLKTTKTNFNKLDANQEIQDNFKFKHTHSSPDIVLEDEDEI